MRLVSFEHHGVRGAGMLEDDVVLPFADVDELNAHTLEHCLVGGRKLHNAALAVADVRLLPPVPRPGKIICVGLNYRSHVTESKRELPEYPVLFTKFSASLVGARDPIVAPAESEQIDFEGELAVVIGRQARRVAEQEAFAVIAGYAVANDVTMRDYQYKTHQWLQGKSWNLSTPVGPALVTHDEVGDPASLRIELRLNGETMQSADVAAMIFDVPRLVSTVSEFTTLDPGDVLLTGTPSGVGFRRDPKVFLTDGDLVEVEIPGVGHIANRVASEGCIDDSGGSAMHATANSRTGIKYDDA